jgi:hypothetical protein
VTFTPTDTANYNTTTGTVSITVNKAAGAAVSAPTLGSKTHNSITVSAVSAPANGQTVEYAVNTGNTAPSTGWQTGTTFTGLSAGTTYHIFARAQENANYNAGAASGGLEVATLQTVSQGRFVYYWVDQHGSLVTTDEGQLTVDANAPLTISAQGTGYSGHQWFVNSVKTGQTGDTYVFSSAKTGKHIVDLVVMKGGKSYSATITVTVE